MTNQTFPTKLLDDLRMVKGLPPYNQAMNYNRGDGYFWVAIVKEFGEDLTKQASAFLDASDGIVSDTLAVSRPAQQFASGTMSGRVYHSEPNFKEVPKMSEAIVENPLFKNATAQEAAQFTESTPSVQEAKRREAAQNLSPEFLAELSEWEQLTKDLAHMVAREKEMRQRIFDACFDKPVEGTNKFDLHGGYKLVASYKINRTVDRAALQPCGELLAEVGHSIEEYIRTKPELETKAYKAADSNVRKILDMAITAKPGLPTLEIVLPKR